jgi:hypothetical protein
MHRAFTHFVVDMTCLSPFLPRANKAGRTTGRRGGLDSLSGMPTGEEQDRDAEIAALKAHSAELEAKLNEQREAHRLELAALADEVEDSR